MSQRLFRSAPLNYLLTAAAGAFLWTLLSVGLGGYLGNVVSLQERTTEEFLSIYRITLGAVLLVALASCFYWYFVGSRPNAAVNLSRARRVWIGSLLLLGVLAVVALLVLVLLLQAEGLTLGNFSLIFLALALLTFLFFWGITLLASPPAVEYIPLGKR